MFESLMERVLSGIPWEVCLLYLDDIIVNANTFDGELERLGSVCTGLRKAGLKLSPKKCHLLKKYEEPYIQELLGSVVPATGEGWCAV